MDHPTEKPFAHSVELWPNIPTQHNGFVVSLPYLLKPLPGTLRTTFDSAKSLDSGTLREVSAQGPGC